jgi:hypothetical protein
MRVRFDMAILLHANRCPVQERSWTVSAGYSNLHLSPPRPISFMKRTAGADFRKLRDSRQELRIRALFRFRF